MKCILLIIAETHSMKVEDGSKYQSDLCEKYHEWLQLIPQVVPPSLPAGNAHMQSWVVEVGCVIQESRCNLYKLIRQ